MLVFESSMPGTILYISRGGLSFTPTTAGEDALVVLGFITRSDFYTRSGFTVFHPCTHSKTDCNVSIYAFKRMLKVSNISSCVNIFLGVIEEFERFFF